VANVAGAYPENWEADVVLGDGRPVHLRPIRSQDGPALQEFHHRLSTQSVIFRYFAPKLELSAEEIERFTHVDHVDRVAIVAIAGSGQEGSEVIGIGTYDRIDGSQAEVAFSVRDDLQGRGLGSVFLEHLAAAAREHGITRFTAEVLPSNARMLATFRRAGYVLSQHLEEDVIVVSFDIEPTQRSRAVIAAREHRAEARSLSRLLHPSSIAVVGASRRAGTVGHALLQHLARCGFTGDLLAVHPEATELLGVTSVPNLRQSPWPVDLAIVAVPAEAVPGVLEDAAAAGVIGLVVVSGGFADSGADGIRRQRSLVEAARLLGVRIVGPNALGMVNTDPSIRMNASLVPALPSAGKVGFFCQSGALGSSILERLQARGLGVSTFVSAGNRADVSGNDLLQYWQDDVSTEVILMYLESMGNARKLARLVRRISGSKPVLMVGSPGAQTPSGHIARSTGLSQREVSGLLAASGLIALDRVDRMLDLAAVLSCQPMPTASGMGIVGNSDALAVLASNAVAREGSRVEGHPATFPRDASVARYRREVDVALAHSDAGALLVIHVPPVEGVDDAGLLPILAASGAAAAKPIVAVMQGMGPTTRIVAGIPVFVDVEDAVAALASMIRLGSWRTRLAQEPTPPQDADPDAIGSIVQAALDEQGTCLTDEQAMAVLACAGLPLGLVDPSVPADCAMSRSDGLRLSLEVDPLFGPVISASLDDPAALLLGDVSTRLAPLHRAHAEEAVGSLRALAARGAMGESTARRRVTDLADAMHRVSWLPAWAASICEVQVNGLHWTDEGPKAASITVRLDPQPEAFDPDARRMGE